MVTIKDVAKRAGVSIATVSRIINGADNVGERYRIAVQRAIDELEYQPNAVAQSMKKRTFRTIGVIMSDFSVPFFEKILKKIERAYRSNGNLVLFVNTYEDPEVEKKGIQFMVEKQADVLIIASTGANEDYLARLQDKGLSVIFIDRRSRAHQFPSIYVDKRVGMYHVLEYLTQMGHREIAFISGPRHLSTNYDRYSGASDFFYEKLLDPGKMRYFFGAFSEEYGYSVTEELIKNKSLPTAILVGSAILASGVIMCCKDYDLKIPQDVSLVSFGDLAFGKLVEPRLTYVYDGHTEIGDCLVDMIQMSFDQKLERKNIVLQPQLIVNKSVRKLDSRENA